VADFDSAEETLFAGEMIGAPTHYGLVTLGANRHHHLRWDLVGDAVCEEATEPKSPIAA